MLTCYAPQGRLLLPHHRFFTSKMLFHKVKEHHGAGDEARTRYLDLGKVALYQMSYARRTGLIITDLSPFVKPVLPLFAE